MPPKDRSLLVISVAVIAFHSIALLMAIYSSNTPPTVKPHPMERLVVKTIALGEKKKLPAVTAPSPPKQEVAIASTPEPEPLPSPPAVEPAPPKPQESPPPPPKPEVAASKKIEPKPKKKAPEKKVVAKTDKKMDKVKETAKQPVAQVEKKPAKKVEYKPDPQVEAAKAKQRELLAKAQESFAKIGQNKSKPISTSSNNDWAKKMPGQITNLEIDALPSGEMTALSSKEMGYRDEIASRLKLLLSLPEYGEVKVKLTLERTGKVNKVAIVSAESKLNRTYIENTLPAMSFPHFGSNFDGLSQYTFLINLSNDY